MIKIDINDIFGDYQIISRDKTKIAAAKYWNCKCILCGKEKSIRADVVRKGPNCNCKNGQELIGFISNEFKVLEKTDKRARDECIIYKCVCQNYGYIDYIASNVLKDYKKHCPKCYQRKTTLIDLAGETFGFLTVLERDLSTHIGHEEDAYWICRCNKCNSIKTVRGVNLRKGVTRSCGCIKSHGEECIAKILVENNVLFQREYTFPNLIHIKPLRFDFAIFTTEGELSHLVEYQGSQHFYYQNSGWNTEENFIKTQQRDKIKKQFCEKHNIKIIYINYNENITFEKIMGKVNENNDIN